MKLTPESSRARRVRFRVPYGTRNLPRGAAGRATDRHGTPRYTDQRLAGLWTAAILSPLPGRRLKRRPQSGVENAALHIAPSRRRLVGKDELQAGDDLDALILSDLALKQMPEGQIIAWMPDGVLNPGLDEALFSLAAGSPSLGAAFSPGDVFYTDFQGSFSLWVSAAQLGLLAADELNALDTMPHPEGGPPIPEPGTLVLVLLSGVGLLGRRAGRRR